MALITLNRIHPREKGSFSKTSQRQERECLRTTRAGAPGPPCLGTTFLPRGILSRRGPQDGGRGEGTGTATRAAANHPPPWGPEAGERTGLDSSLGEAPEKRPADGHGATRARPSSQTGLPRSRAAPEMMATVREGWPSSAVKRGTFWGTGDPPQKCTGGEQSRVCIWGSRETAEEVRGWVSG